MDETLRLGSHLRYPITITALLKRHGDTVLRGEAALQYSYRWSAKYDDPVTGEEKDEERISIVDWDSPAEGNIKAWRVKVGQAIQGDCDCLVVEEPCSHSVQFQGICGMCGKDMTEVTYASATLDTIRAPINMTHDQTNLLVSRRQAQRAESELQRRLLQQRKLSLVVDLDQTVIHACIDPTVGEWQRDPQNPNHGAVKDIQSFQLDDDGPRGLANGCWYYIKLRPGLTEFLDTVSNMYELHVYTMGTRAYAQHIAEIIDPYKRLFGNRVISRDENGSVLSKSLQRIFPVSTNMVVIIDDRADVWPHNRPNLIKVVPYDFFKGVGDINSSFLPKRQDDLLEDNEVASDAIPPRSNSQLTLANVPTSVESIDQLSLPVESPNTGENILKLQAEEQERTLEKQLTQRPLQHMQDELDNQESINTDDLEIDSTDTTNHKEALDVRPRHHILIDHDTELIHLAKHLATLHSAFFAMYNASKEPKHIPDVGQVLNDMKAEVLRGTTIVLSGLVPLGISPYKSEIGLQAIAFGADLHTEISPNVTHLVVSSHHPRTDKVRKAASIASIKIVNERWLADSISQWLELDEADYLVEASLRDQPAAKNEPLHPVDLATDASPNIDAEVTTSDIASDDEATGIEIHEDDGGLRSPIAEMKTFDWKALDEEMEDFLQSDSDTMDSDFDDDLPKRGESVSQPTDSISNMKRKHHNDTDHGDPSEQSSQSTTSGSKLAKRQRLNEDRGFSNLSSVSNTTGTGPDHEDANISTELPVRDANGQTKTDQQIEDDLEADLLAELEAEMAGEG